MHVEAADEFALVMVLMMMMMLQGQRAGNARRSGGRVCCGGESSVVRPVPLYHAQRSQGTVSSFPPLPPSLPPPFVTYCCRRWLWKLHTTQSDMQWTRVILLACRGCWSACRSVCVEVCANVCWEDFGECMQ